MTRAEFTLGLNGADFYDVETINGHNIPLAMYAKTGVRRSSDPYFCGAPGAPSPQTPVGGCSWNLNPPSVYYNWVSTGGKSCGSNSDCGGQTCGLSNNVGQNPRFKLTCGNLLGYWSADQICGIDNNFGYPFNCNQQLGGPNAGMTLTMMYACSNGLPSCYADGAPNSCCGCQNWNQLGLNVPSETTQCHNVNPNWQNLVLPTIQFLKAACPTSYTFPFDDMSSTFTCQDNAGGAYNSVSYDIVWCPSGSSGNQGNQGNQGNNPPPPPPPSNNGGIQWSDSGNFRWALGCDFQGNDLSSAQVPGSQCGSTCQSTPGCTHMAWTPPSNCWLKTNGVQQSNAISSSTNGIVCGYITSSPPPPPPPPPPSGSDIGWVDNGNLAWAMACDFVGGDIGSVQIDGAGCGPSCLGNGACTHFSWTPPSSCWLKGGSVSRASAHSSGTQGIVCGIRQGGSNAVVDNSSTDTNSSTSPSVPTWAVAAIVLASLVVLVLVLITILLGRYLSNIRSAEKA